jgi:ABC-2 type transport system ATP-binding protein
VPELIIQTKELSHFYQKGVQTLHTLNLEVEQGSIYGFLGPNGSGKTTTLSLLLGLLKTQQGSIRIFGQELAGNRLAVLKRLGSLIETPSLYGHLTATENLELYRRIYGMPKERIAEVLQLVRLEDTGRKTAKKFSLGMKQRLSIALALLPRPELLILDEPTNGLDPSGIVELRELLKDLNLKEGITILISSHILAEVERLVSHVGIIAKGRMVFQGTLPELQNLQKAEGNLQLQTSDNGAARQLLKAYHTETVADGLTVAISGPEEIASLNRLLVHHGIDVYRLQPQTSNLEQLFINLTNSPS